VRILVLSARLLFHPGYAFRRRGAVPGSRSPVSDSIRLLSHQSPSSAYRFPAKSGLTIYLPVEVVKELDARWIKRSYRVRPSRWKDFIAD
jgi:hypothetical protein